MAAGDESESDRRKFGVALCFGNDSLFAARLPDRAETVIADLRVAIERENQAVPTINPRIRITAIKHGPVRTRIHWISEPIVEGLFLFGHFDLFAGSPVVRIQLSIRNTRPANHPGGNWDLGNGGSIFIHEMSFSVKLPPSTGPTAIRCSPERGRPFSDRTDRLDLVQESSGGENWKHHTHINRDRVVPHRYRGYRLTATGKTEEGLRATPIVSVSRDGYFVGLTMPEFWENFPKTIEADETGIAFHLFPKHDSGPHELQGGEQKTHTFFVAFDRDDVTDEPLQWCRSPLLVHADPEWYAASGAIPYLTPAATDPNGIYNRLANQAIEGPDTFFTKREVIDEYGWRNFGDVHADHEAVFHKGGEALVSHYNNQFDVVGGCAIQFLRSADPRWWSLLIPAADHTCDIDSYHTQGDKKAYNGGLFPFTFHYADADASTHRGYPKSLLHWEAPSTGRDLDSLGATGAALKRATARGLGGGPSASHIYNQGLMLAYFLTGNPIYKESAIDQADYILAIDAPRSLFRLLSSEYSGAATASGGSYHGPGRASGNSILALLVGHRLTGRREYLDKAEHLIRRVSHPRQDIESLDLLNAELRWFYVMHLQALGKYLDDKAELGELDSSYAYARETLLHFARWMADNEHPFLDRAATLQYPTETWAAQDLRKVEVFQFAAKHATGADKERFLERAEWFFRNSETTLQGFATRSVTRAVNLLMNFGWSRAWWQLHPDAIAPEPLEPLNFEALGEWRMFVAQKDRAIRRAKLLVAFGAIVGTCGLVGLLIAVL